MRLTNSTELNEGCYSDNFCPTNKFPPLEDLSVYRRVLFAGILRYKVDLQQLADLEEEFNDIDLDDYM